MTEVPQRKKCTYCGRKTKNVLELGRTFRFIELPCCERCFELVNEMSPVRKNEMSEAAAISSSLQKNQPSTRG